MERVLTQEERIRRAEEIYLRRRNLRPQYRETINTKTNTKGKSIKLFKRMALQIIICLLLYCIFYLIYDTNYSFSDNTISKTQEILNYDINFNEIYNSFSQNIKSFIKKEDNSTQENKEESKEENNDVQNNDEQMTNEINNVDTLVDENQNQEEIVQQVEQTSAVEPSLRDLYPLILPVKRGIYFIGIWRKRIYIRDSIY